MRNTLPGADYRPRFLPNAYPSITGNSSWRFSLVGIPDGGGAMVMQVSTEVEAVDILFIADDPDLAEMYRLKLELDGYWVRVVQPEAAVAEALRHRPELVFLDLPAG